jgi:hypothetical protein
MRSFTSFDVFIVAMVREARCDAATFTAVVRVNGPRGWRLGGGASVERD